MKFKVISFNIWFENIDIVERTKSLVESLFLEDADIVCLQEVRPYIYEALKLKLGKIYKYNYPETLQQNYGCIILSKHKFISDDIIPFKNTKMGRNLTLVEIKPSSDEGSNIVVCTTHYESEFKKNNIIKKEQFIETRDLLNQYSAEKIILCCDSNICNSDEEDVFISDNDTWKDGWVRKGNNQNKYTYDFMTNYYPRYKRRSRLDRIVYKGLDADDFDFVELIETNYFPSDHHGIKCLFDLK